MSVNDSTKLAAIRLLCLDVDGVLTDGHLYWHPGPVWSQRFCVRDGYGITRLRQAGIEVAILSGGEVPSGIDRARSLGIKLVRFGQEDKLAAYHEVTAGLGIQLNETAYIGDELVDIPLLQRVGFSATVPDAVPAVRQAVHYVTQLRGGHGAVREVCDLILAERATH